jgi:hypothetical protein
VVLFPGTSMEWSAQLHLVMSDVQFCIDYEQDPIDWGVLKITSSTSSTIGPKFKVNIQRPSIATAIKAAAAAAQGGDAVATARSSSFGFEAFIDGNITLFKIFDFTVRINITTEKALIYFEAAFWFLRCSLHVHIQIEGKPSFRAIGSFAMESKDEIKEKVADALGEANDAAQAKLDAAKVGIGNADAAMHASKRRAQAKIDRQHVSLAVCTCPIHFVHARWRTPTCAASLVGGGRWW